MIGTDRCVYETPCGWCSKWDKSCDKKQPKQEIDDKVWVYDGPKVKEIINEVDANKACNDEHDWECCGISTNDTSYRCKRCGIYKREPRLMI